MSFRAEVFDAGAVAVVKVQGELDLAAAHGVRRIERYVAGGTRDVVLDLEGLEFIDVAGMRALVGTIDHLTSSGHVVTVRAVPAGTRKVAELLGVSGHLREGQLVGAPT